MTLFVSLERGGSTGAFWHATVFPLFHTLKKVHLPKRESNKSERQFRSRAKAETHKVNRCLQKLSEIDEEKKEIEKWHIKRAIRWRKHTQTV